MSRVSWDNSAAETKSGKEGKFADSASISEELCELRLLTPGPRPPPPPTYAPHAEKSRLDLCQCWTIDGFSRGRGCACPRSCSDEVSVCARPPEGHVLGAHQGGEGVLCSDLRGCIPFPLSRSHVPPHTEFSRCCSGGRERLGRCPPWRSGSGTRRIRFGRSIRQPVQQVRESTQVSQSLIQPVKRSAL